MRRLGGWLTLVAVLGILAGGYWAGVAAIVKSRISDVPGLSAQAVDVQGFPARFELTLVQPAVQMAGGQWRAPRATATAPAYWPFALQVQVPPQQALTLDTDLGELAVTDAALSVALHPGTDLRLKQAGIHGAAFLWRVPPGITRRGADLPLVRSGRFGVDLDAVEGADYALAVSVADAAVDLAAFGLDPAGPDAGDLNRLDITSAQINALLQFDAPLSALVQTLPTLRAVSDIDVAATWDESAINARGDVQVDARGEISGALELDIAGWQAVLDRGRRMNLWDARTHTMLALAAATFAADSGNGGTLRAPVTIDAGVVRLGPLVIGRLPPVR